MEVVSDKKQVYMVVECDRSNNPLNRKKHCAEIEYVKELCADFESMRDASMEIETAKKQVDEIKQKHRLFFYHDIIFYF